MRTDVPEYDSHLIEMTRLYTRDMLSHCTDAELVAETTPSQCCMTSEVGQVCFFVSTKAGNEKGHIPGSYYPKIDPKTFNGHYYWERAKPCDFGYCTNGKEFTSQPSPPPPPPFQAPPMPKTPGFPDMPPSMIMPPLPSMPTVPPYAPSRHGLTQVHFLSSFAPVTTQLIPIIYTLRCSS